ncbi:MAG: sugar phosphate isomerase/epimerase [Lachnospiraceae bacterium]|nr:sugar phosphate isomerase/epimerase [Lachnospiraceae bacterium]
MIHSVAISEMVGTNYYSPLKGNLKECMKQAAELGFDGVELHVRSPKLDYAELADYAASLNLKITTIGTGMACHYDGHYMTNPNYIARQAAIDCLNQFMEAGKASGGAAIMFCLMKGPLPDPKLREFYKDMLYESLLPVVDTAERLGVDLTIEAANRFQSSYLWSTEETLDFVNRFKSDRVTIHLDSFHMNIEDPNFYESIVKCGKKLGHFHFSDNDRCYPGHGHIDFKEILLALKEIGYMKNGVGAYEYDSIPNCLESAKLGLAHIKKLEKELGLK